MVGVSVKAAMVVMAAILAFIAVFCYDLGCSANTIRPGRGDVLINISSTAVAFTLLAALNVAFVHRRAVRRRVRDEEAPGHTGRRDNGSSAAKRGRATRH